MWTWQRWNNYGIGLLDGQQYEAAVHAFERVAALRPDYADAYSNMGIVEISWEKYDDAKANLAKALTLLPGDPRALYYRAIVERNASQIKEAIADLEAVLVKYPRAKDALRELGFSYYQQHDYTQARDTYQRIQVIDPDDLAAHYQLAILYRRLGDPKSRRRSSTSTYRAPANRLALYPAITTCNASLTVTIRPPSYASTDSSPLSPVTK